MYFFALAMMLKTAANNFKQHAQYQQHNMVMRQDTIINYTSAEFLLFWPLVRKSRGVWHTNTCSNLPLQIFTTQPFQLVSINRQL